MESQNHKTETICKVCGDKASGKHYGVSSCDGCRGFFKRSIRRNLEYVCKENGRCIVDVTRRNQCQACRFKKCLQVNMKRDAVQHERAPRTNHPPIHHYPIGLTPRFRHLQSSTSVFSNLPLHFPSSPLIDHHLNTPFLGGQSYLHHGLIYPPMLGGFQKHNGIHCNVVSGTSISGSYLDQTNEKTKSDVTGSSRDVLKDDEVTSSEEVAQERNCASDSSRTVGCRLELPILKDAQVKPTSLIPAESPCVSVFADNVYESAAKLLFLAIKWARTIPSFLQLSYRDQSILLEESWNELFVLTAAQWSLPIDEALLTNNTISPPAKLAALEEDARRLREVISRLNMLRVDHTEHACLKALVLFKAECRGLCEPAHIELLQDQTHVMLHEYCAQRQAHPKGRFGKLLLTLPAVQSISRKGLEELLFRQTVGDVAIDKLLGALSRVAYN